MTDDELRAIRANASIPNIAAWMRHARRGLRMTQAMVADKSGLSRSYLVLLESGKVGLPKPETRAKFHSVFRTSDEELFDLGLIELNQFDEERPVKVAQKPIRATPRFDVDARGELMAQIQSLRLTPARIIALSEVMRAFSDDDAVKRGI